MKAQKSWNACDLAVSAASGTAWLGHVPVDDPGSVVLFWGEGDDASLVRRIDAVCDARGLDPDRLAIVVCCRAPHLTNRLHRAEFDRQVAETRPRLVILDPFYLAARGANGADLYAMGEVLEHPQRTCVAAGAALFIVTHFNRKDGRGALRITGAGPAEWGRVLIAATVKSRRTDPQTKATTVITELDCIGGEIPDTTLRVTRTITADDPDDLDSALRLHLAVSEIDPTDDADDDMPPARRKLLEALRAATGPRTGNELVDWIAAEYGHGLQRQTVSTELNELLRAELADCINHGKGHAKQWVATDQLGASA
jgi:AAA domain